MNTIDELSAKRDVNGLIEVLQKCLQLKNRDDPNKSDWAVQALGEIGDARAVKPLLDIMRLDYSSWRYTQNHASEALVKIGVTAVEPLIHALQDENSDVRWRAAAVLGRIGDIRAIEPLLSYLGEYCAKEATIQDIITDSLEKFGISAYEPLSAALQNNPHAHVRQVAVLVLARLRDARAVEPLITALQDSNSDVRRVAAIKLGMFGDVRAVEPLIGSLKDGSADVRRVAAQSLGQIGDTRAGDPLKAVLQNENEFIGIRQVAAKALHSLKIDMVRMALIELHCIHCHKATRAIIPDDALEKPKDPEVKCEECGQEFTFTEGMLYRPISYV